MVSLHLEKANINLSSTRAIALLGLPKSTLYYQASQPIKDEALKEMIQQVLAVRPSYGHRRIALELNLGRKKIRRVMKKFDLKPYKRKARWRKRRDERRKEAPYPNLIKNICPLKPNLIWATDFTYLRFKGRYLYLATIMDLFTREVVGWSISSRHTREFVIDTFWDAFQATGKLPQVIHSDQGAEYNCQDYLKLMERLGIQVSMSKKASPWENGYQESFFNNFKTDLGLEFDRFDSTGELIEVVHYLVNDYNQNRIHTSLKTSPIKFKLLHQLKPMHKPVQ